MRTSLLKHESGDENEVSGSRGKVRGVETEREKVKKKDEHEKERSISEEEDDDERMAVGHDSA